MAEININGRKYTLGDDGLKAGTGDPDAPEEYISVIHDEEDSLTVIGKGSRITNHLDPLYLNDANAGAGIYYYDLPADSWGYGFILVGDAEEYARFMWGRDNHVTLLNASVNVKTTDDSGFCILNNTTSVRLKNSMGLPKRIIFDLHVSESLIAPTFLAFSELSGVDNLDAELTINSITVEPTFRYKLGDADSTGLEPWGYGASLTLQAGTAPTYNDGSPGLGANDDSCKFNGGGYYKNGTAVNQVELEDFVIELVWKNVDENKYIISTLDTDGYYIFSYTEGTGSIGLYVNDVDEFLSCTSGSNSAPEGTWNHGLVYINRDENSNNCSWWFINGLASGTGANLSVAEKTLLSTAFAIGGSIAGANPTSGNLAYCAMWKYTDWIAAGSGGKDEVEAIAAERFARFCGYWPQVANGTYQPTVATRAYPAYLDKYEDGYRKLYYTGNHWMRMCRRQDENFDTVFGYLPETAATNLFTYSEALSNWVLLNPGDAVVDNAAICPDGRTAMASIAGDADGIHGVALGTSLTAATYAMSYFVKLGSDVTHGKDWCRLWDNTIGVGCYFDIANGTVGTATGAATGYIEGPLYSGDATPIYRVCIVFTGTAVSHNLQVRAALADNDDTFAGDGSTPNIYVWGAQCELGDYMTSPIITSGSALARVVDQLRWEDVNNVMLPVAFGNTFIESGFLECDVLMPLVNAENVRYIAEISDGGDTADMFSFPVTATNDLQPSTRATGLSDGDCGTASADLEDNVKHHLRIQWETDSLKASVDGVFGNEDATVGMPEDMDRIDLGSSYDAVTQFNGLIQNFYLWNIEVSEPPA